MIESLAAADFLCFTPLVTACEAESAASSPEASRDDGCRRSAVDDCLIELERFEVRFRFDEPEDDGDDIARLDDLVPFRELYVQISHEL